MSAHPSRTAPDAARATAAALARLIDWYEALTLETLARLAEFYAHDAQFEDPFNQISGRAAIRRVFEHMFETTEAPRFRIVSHLAGEGEAYVTWIFTFRALRRAFELHGATHLRFDARGKVIVHRDYWDAAGELYAKLPVIGALLRVLGRQLRAPQEAS